MTSLKTHDIHTGPSIHCDDQDTPGHCQPQNTSLLCIKTSLSFHDSDVFGLGAGLADPGPVAAALWTDAELDSTVCLDSIVTVVDARNICGQLAEARPEGAVDEAQQQIEIGRAHV